MGRANHILVKYVHDCNLLSTFIGCNSFKFAILFAFLKRGALLKTTSYDSLYRSEQYFLAKTFCLKVFLPKNAVELKNRIVGCAKWYKKPLLDWFPKMSIEFQKFQFLNQKKEHGTKQEWRKEKQETPFDKQSNTTLPFSSNRASRWGFCFVCLSAERPSDVSNEWNRYHHLSQAHRQFKQWNLIGLRKVGFQSIWTDRNLIFPMESNGETQEKNWFTVTLKSSLRLLSYRYCWCLVFLDSSHKECNWNWNKKLCFSRAITAPPQKVLWR